MPDRKSQRGSAHAIWAEKARDPETHFAELARALSAFADRPQVATPEELQTVLQGLARGEALVTQAYEWRDPLAGRASSSSLAAIRGLQWRLVMAVAGLEIMLKSLLGKEHPGIHEFRLLEEQLPDFELSVLDPPLVGKRIREDWIADERILTFLSLRAGDLKILKRWMIDAEPLVELANHLAVAKALRNCTAHAALSASKCKQLKFADAMKQLPATIYRVREGVYARLCEKIVE